MPYHTRYAPAFRRPYRQLPRKGRAFPPPPRRPWRSAFSRRHCHTRMPTSLHCLLNHLATYPHWCGRHGLPAASPSEGRRHPPAPANTPLPAWVWVHILGCYDLCLGQMDWEDGNISRAWAAGVSMEGGGDNSSQKALCGGMIYICVYTMAMAPFMTPLLGHAMPALTFYLPHIQILPHKLLQHWVSAHSCFAFLHFEHTLHALTLPRFGHAPSPGRCLAAARAAASGCQLSCPSSWEQASTALPWTDLTRQGQTGGGWSRSSATVAYPACLPLHTATCFPTSCLEAERRERCLPCPASSNILHGAEASLLHCLGQGSTVGQLKNTKNSSMASASC